MNPPTPSQKYLIGLAGYAGSGKDAIATELVQQHGFQRVAFADAVKGVARTLGWDGAKDDAGRQMLQEVGMLARQANPDHWVAQVEAQFDGHRVVVTDVRFQNEVEAIRRAGGVVLRVTRGGVGPVNEHLSEIALGDGPLDGVLRNDGDRETLADRAAEALELGRQMALPLGDR